MNHSLAFAATGRLVRGVARPLPALLLLLLAGLAGYGSSLGGRFIWDDAFLVERNAFIRSPVLAGETFRHFLFYDSASTFYRPVQNLSFALDYQVWGLDPFGYRLTNLLLHVGVGWGIFLLGCKLLPGLLRGVGAGGLPAPALALGVALLWTVHPVHSAAVAYVAGRADSLAAGFALGAWLLFGRGARTGVDPAARAGWYAGAAFALLLALGSKEMALIWVALFAGHLCFFQPGFGAGRRARVLGGVLLCVGVYAALRQLPVPPPGMIAPTPPPLSQRWVLVLRALGDYAGLLLWPGRLCMERQVFVAYGPEYNTGLAGYYRALTVAGPVFLAALTALAVWPGPARRLRLFGAGWFLLTFLPVSNVFVLNASVAEHWLYVPSVGFALFLAGVLAWASTATATATIRFPRLWPAAATAVFCGLLLPALTWRTARRAADWRDPETFAARTIADGGDSPRMRNLLATSRMARGELVSAEALLRGLRAQAPDNATASINLAHNLLRQGREAEAIPLLNVILTAPPSAEIRPLTTALADFAVLAAADPVPAGLPTADVRADRLADARRRYPQAWDLRALTVRQLRHAGRRPEARAEIEDYAARCPWRYEAILLLGDCRAETGDPAGALEAYARAGRLDTREATSWLRRAALLLNQGRREEARAALATAWRRQPSLRPDAG